MDVYLLRHGKTEWNDHGWFQGSTDVPLAEEGRQQAIEAAKMIREAGITFDRVISSPLSRAKETACLVSGVPEGELQIEERIREMTFGLFEGTNFFSPDYPGWEKAERPFNGLFEDPEHYDPPEGGESFPEFLGRTGSFLEDLKALSADETAPSSVLVVAHGAAIRAILLHLQEQKLASFWNIRVPNCRLYHFAIDGDTVRECPDPLGLPPAEAWT